VAFNVSLFLPQYIMKGKVVMLDKQEWGFDRFTKADAFF